MKIQVYNFMPLQIDACFSAGAPDLAEQLCVFQIARVDPSQRHAALLTDSTFDRVVTPLAFHRFPSVNRNEVLVALEFQRDIQVGEPQVKFEAEQPLRSGVLYQPAGDHLQGVAFQQFLSVAHGVDSAEGSRKCDSDLLTVHPVGELAGKFRSTKLACRNPRSADDRYTVVCGFRSPPLLARRIYAGLEFRRQRSLHPMIYAFPPTASASRFSEGSPVVIRVSGCAARQGDGSNAHDLVPVKKKPPVRLDGCSTGGSPLKLSASPLFDEKLAYKAPAFKTENIRHTLIRNLPPSHPGRATKHETRNEHGNEK